MSQTEVQLIKNGAVVDADINGMSSSKLSGALPAISGASLTNLPTPVGKVRNLIINGAMQVAQRGTSSTSSGYHTVDRFSVEINVNEAPTQAQVDVASGTTPYTLGFRKALKITNGNQTGGAGGTNYIQIMHRVEAQNMATSGWNYTSSSSFITLSFYIKSSVAQAFSGSLRSQDGTSQSFKFDTPSLSADTWTKVTKIIPGNSNVTFNNDNGTGLDVYLYPFIGTTYTTANSDTETWVTGTGGNYANDMTTTWYTTNDATFELTGVQLEIGNVATDFEHRSFADEIRRCRRYFCKYVGPLNINFVNEHPNNTAGYLHFPFYEEMRASPTVTMGSSVNIGRPQVSVSQKIQSAADISPNCFNVIGWSGQGSLGSTGDAYYRMSLSESDANSTISCNAEL